MTSRGAPAAVPVPGILRAANCSGVYGHRRSALAEVLHDGTGGAVTLPA